VPKFINKTVMVILLCLIFIGQSMASMTMFYGMASMSTMNAKSSMAAVHQQMSASDEGMVSNSDCHTEMVKSINDDTTTNDDCCAQECDCLTNGCSTVSAFFANTNYSAESAISSKITSNHFLFSSQALTSLYRPPIIS